MVASILDAFPDEVAEHIERGRCPRPAARAPAPISRAWAAARSATTRRTTASGPTGPTPTPRRVWSGPDLPFWHHPHLPIRTPETAGTPVSAPRTAWRWGRIGRCTPASSAPARRPSRRCCWASSRSGWWPGPRRSPRVRRPRRDRVLDDRVRRGVAAGGDRRAGRRRLGPGCRGRGLHDQPADAPLLGVAGTAPGGLAAARRLAGGLPAHRPGLRRVDHPVDGPGLGRARATLVVLPRRGPAAVGHLAALHHRRADSWARRYPRTCPSTSPSRSCSSCCSCPSW